jgi:hypothetical protein
VSPGVSVAELVAEGVGEASIRSHQNMTNATPVCS